MEYKNLLELIKTVSESNISDFKYEEGDTKIYLSQLETEVKDSKGDMVTLDMVTNISNDEKNIYEAETKNNAKDNTKVDAVNTLDDASLLIVKSPLVGTFYSASSEDAKAFVTIGDNVKKGQTLAIIEAMKLMNDIESDFDGVIKKIYVNNGDSVEYGQPLFAIG